VGYAKTLQWEDYVDEHGDPYEMTIKSVDSVDPGDVVVSVVSGDNKSALWGELLSTATRMRGGRGAIVDGGVRDVEQMQEMGFPCFARYKTPRDSARRQNIVAIDEPVLLHGVQILPRDMIMIDTDGMVVIPSDKAEEVIDLALKKVKKEDKTRQELLKGRLLEDVYREYGVL
jgi:regulator of RNase E activity RraA